MSPHFDVAEFSMTTLRYNISYVYVSMYNMCTYVGENAACSVV